MENSYHIESKEKVERGKETSLVRKLVLAGVGTLVLMAGCSLDRFYIGAYSPGRGETDPVEEAKLNREFDEWYERNKNLPPERREPFRFPLFRYKAR
jgi:hypothetical protein